MPVTIDNLFGLQQMGTRAELFRSSARHQYLRSKFSSEPCFSDLYRYDKLEFERSLAPFTGRTTASKAVKTEDNKPAYVPLAHIRIHKKFLAGQLFTTREPGEISDNAAAAVERAWLGLEKRIDLTVERMCSLALSGSLAFNTTNFPDSELVGQTVSYGVTTLSAVSASWATASTKIASDDVQDWKDEIEDGSGFTIREMIFNRQITKYLLGNTEIQNWIQRTQRGINTFETSMLGKFGGVDMWTEYNGHFKPEGGSVTKMVADNAVIALPESGEDAGLVLAEGFGEIPVNAIGGPGGGPAGAVRATGRGKFRYALPLDGDPPGVKLVCGWYGIPVIKLPEAIGYIADVTA